MPPSGAGTGQATGAQGLLRSALRRWPGWMIKAVLRYFNDLRFTIDVHKIKEYIIWYIQFVLKTSYKHLNQKKKSTGNVNL